MILLGRVIEQWGLSITWDPRVVYRPFEFRLQANPLTPGLWPGKAVLRRGLIALSRQVNRIFPDQDGSGHSGICDGIMHGTKRARWSEISIDPGFSADRK